MSRGVSTQAVPGGELVIGVTQDDYRVDPPERANIGFFPLNTNIFESLVRLTPDYQIEPWLAESWEFIEPNTYRFTLRPDVMFHDGTPLAAEAVQWSMGRIAQAGGGILGIDENSTTVIDDLTVEITPIRPNLRLLEQLNHPNESIIAPNSNPVEERIGTGPFREVEYVKDDRYVVEAFDGYWGAEQPGVQRITFRFFPDATTRVLALQAGEVDLITQVPRESASQLELGGDLRLVTTPVGAYEALYVNIHGAEPYDLGQDRAVREALAHAISKEAIVTGVWQGYAEVSSTMIPPGILGSAADTIQGTTLDPERAQQILDDAGWAPGSDGIREKDGRRLRLTMVVGFPNADVHRPMPELVQAQLREVGIEVEIVQTPDTATYEARLAVLEGDLWAEAGSQNDGNPCFLPDLLFYTPDPEGDPESAMYGTAFAPGEAFDVHIDSCRTAVSVEEVQTAAAAAMKLLVDEEYVVIPLAGTFGLYGASARVGEFEPHPSGINQRWSTLTVQE
ncbi:MAG: ABC transporter substrate-binding protein [Chloroflexota bacterium]|nr:ABC transporter substrate-binding protein [Chloroflexota bacterium]